MKSSSGSIQTTIRSPTPSPDRDKTDHFYEVHLAFGRDGGADHSVWYRTPMNLSPENVPKYAVRDGDLLDVFMHNVDYVLEVTPEEYFEHMWE